MSDRTVHARIRNFEVVRYDRAGKWYVENRSVRSRVTIQEAARWAIWARKEGGDIFTGRAGGQSFDRLVARLSAAVSVPGEETSGR